MTVWVSDSAIYIRFADFGVRGRPNSFSILVGPLLPTRPGSRCACVWVSALRTSHFGFVSGSCIAVDATYRVYP